MVVRNVVAMAGAIDDHHRRPRLIMTSSPVRCGKLVLLYAIALGVLEARNFLTSGRRRLGSAANQAPGLPKSTIAAALAQHHQPPPLLGARNRSLAGTLSSRICSRSRHQRWAWAPTGQSPDYAAARQRNVGVTSRWV
jgi:hypothetical protein